MLGTGNALTRQLNKNNTLANLVPIQACQFKSMIHSLSPCLHGALLNCQSAINKSQDIQLEVTTNDLNFCAHTEIWLKVEDNVTPLHFCPSGYSILSIPRKDKQDGGVGILYHNKPTMTKGKLYDFDSMECTDFKVSPPGSSLNVTIIYCPPDTSILSFVE